MKERGITEEKLDMLRYSGIDLEQFLRGFSSVEESVEHSVSVLRNHPLLPEEVPVHGLVIDRYRKIRFSCEWLRQLRIYFVILFIWDRIKSSRVERVTFLYAYK